MPLTLLFIVIFISLLFLFLKQRHHKFPPPGPKPWPIIGHIHLLGSKPHKSIAKLSKIYGPIMSLKLGSINTIVISSPSVAREMFFKHDLAFSSRPISDAMTAVDHNKLSIVWLPVCPKWRHLRKIAAVQLFTNHRMDVTTDLRHKKVGELVNFVNRCCEKGQAIDIGKAMFTTTLNLLSNTIFSIDLWGYDSLELQQFKELIRRAMEELAKPNVSDFFPYIKWLDLQGIRRKSTIHHQKILKVFEDLVLQRMTDSSGLVKNDVLSTLLNLVKEGQLSLEDVKHLLMDLFAAGTDTTSTTLEWAMTELLRHPEKMTKAQIELNQLIGKNGLVEEADISKLSYIQAILKEIMRLHPAAPFLLPHKVTEHVQLCNYDIPKNAHVWINVWSMGRDASVWPNPESFLPERFLGKEIDMQGQHLELIPFGAGRRICPGLPLAQRMVHLTLANLLYIFNWKLANGMDPMEVDMDDKFGLTLQKNQPLKAIPYPK